MKANVETPLDDELRPEYDETLLKNGVRGKYVQRYRAGIVEPEWVKVEREMLARWKNLPKYHSE